MNHAQAIAQLQRENAELKQRLAREKSILYQRAEPVACAMIDALNGLAQMADQGNPAAIELLQNWKAALVRAEAGADKIPVARELPNGLMH